MRPFLTSHKPGVEFGAVVAGGAGREVVPRNPLPRGDLLERFNRLAAEMPGGLYRGHPLGRPHVGQVLRCLRQVFGRFGQCQGDPRERHLA